MEVYARMVRQTSGRIDRWVGEHPLLGCIAIFAIMAVGSASIGVALGHGWRWGDWSQLVFLDLFLAVMLVWAARGRSRRSRPA